MFCFSLIRMQAASVSEKTKHHTLLLTLDFFANEVPDEAVEGLVLGLISEGSAVGVHVRSIDETCTSSVTDLPELLRPSHLSRSLLDLAIWVFPLGELRVADHVGVVGSRLADTVHHVVFLGELTRNALNRVDKGYFSHGVFGNRAEHRPLAFIKERFAVRPRCCWIVCLRSLSERSQARCQISRSVSLGYPPCRGRGLRVRS